MITPGEFSRSLTPSVVPAERFSVFAEERPDEDTFWTTVIRTIAHSQEDAEQEASGEYLRIRHAAGLPPAEPQVIGVMSPIFAPPAWQRLYDEAAQLLHGGRHELSVVRAQTAAEMLARDALRGIVGRYLVETPLEEELFRLVNPNLRDGHTRRLLKELTGAVVEHERWWSDYNTHVQRHNKVVHQDLAVTRDQATASLEAVNAFIEWLRGVWEHAVMPS